MKKYNFIYKTTNLITGKSYIGLHSTDDINDGYLGSGTYLQKAVKKYGVENFSREIIEYLTGRDGLLEREVFWILEHDTMVPNGYNIRLKVGSEFSRIGKSFTMSESAKEKIRESRKTVIFTDEYRINLSEAHKGHKHSEEIKQRIKKGCTGWHHTEEVKKKISEAQKNRVRGPLTEEHRKKIGESLKGTVFSEERKRNISLAKTGVPCPQGQRVKISQTLKGRKAPLYTCPKCGKTGGKGAMLAFHKCKIA